MKRFLHAVRLVAIDTLATLCDSASEQLDAERARLVGVDPATPPQVAAAMAAHPAGSAVIAGRLEVVRP